MPQKPLLLLAALSVAATTVSAAEGQMRCHFQPQTRDDLVFLTQGSDELVLLVGFAHPVKGGDHECSWAAPAGAAGSNGHLFSFFSPDHPEVLVKVVNGCAVNGHWWVYAGLATDLQVTVAVQHNNQTDRDKLVRAYTSWVTDPLPEDISLQLDPLGAASSARARVGPIASSDAFPCIEPAGDDAAAAPEVIPPRELVPSLER